MNIKQALEYTNAGAVTPDQLIPYVSSVSDVQSELVGDYLVHKKDSNIVLVGYSLQNPFDTNGLNPTLEKIVSQKHLESISVLAPIRPSIAPEKAISSAEDAYWFIDLPLTQLNVKVRNMLVSSERESYIRKTAGQGAWTGEHQELMLNYIRTKGMEAGLCSILQRLGTYLIKSPESIIFSAYAKDTEKLLAYALGDFTSFSSAFYMFAFRQEVSIPGVADLVLFSLLNEAKDRGYTQCNLGLGINSGIRFYKQKWGAKPTLPFIQTTWQIENSKKTWFSRFID